MWFAMKCSFRNGVCSEAEAASRKSFHIPLCGGTGTLPAQDTASPPADVLGASHAPNSALDRLAPLQQNLTSLAAGQFDLTVSSATAASDLPRCRVASRLPILEKDIA